ncbi:MAG: universal stress protein [Rhodobacteraceae bacterium]|jgi:nucleotide-binding universal stress UspA family protein|nr:universal stress protein [Alphaproteobacteria bacterium]MBT8474607.1 universal stress protein [Alphaproteobacteria bacterium]NNF70960.1 universal stress protein [Paracoccaceae bacterium]NNK68329.1 universal stress protein [Paracoccaceae bacterium]
MFKSVLLPIDLSAENSWSRAAPVAIKMAQDGNAPLHVVTVVPDFGMSVVGSYFEPGFEKEALHRIGEALGEWVSANVPEGVEVHAHVLHGRIYDEILTAAEKLGIDAIVMGSHQPGLKDYLLGPNAASVVRHAKQSVFVVRGGD